MEIIAKCDKNLKEERQEEESKRSTAYTLFLEATERLKKGVKGRNMEEIKLAEELCYKVKPLYGRKKQKKDRKAIKFKKSLKNGNPH